MKKFKGTYMTKEQYIDWLIQGIQIDARDFAESHYAGMKQVFADRIYKNQSELVELGYTWEQVEEIEIKAYQTA